MTIEINGMAHVILTVSRFDVARDFYRKLLPQFGQSEGLSLAPTEILLCWIGVPKSINTCAGRNALLIR